jgi:hypothetical protein
MLDRAHLTTLLANPGAGHASGCSLPQRTRMFLRATSRSQVPCPPPGLQWPPDTTNSGFHPADLCTLHTSTHHLYVAGPAAGTLLSSACAGLRSLPGILEPLRCLLLTVRCSAVSSALLDFCPLGLLLFYFLPAWHHEIYDTTDFLHHLVLFSHTPIRIKTT